MESNTSSRQQPVDDGVDLLDMLVVLSRNAKLLVLGSLAVGLLALGFSFLIPPTFTATTRILPPQQQQGAAAMLAQQLGSLAGLSGMATGIKNPAATYVAMLESRTIADELINRFGLMSIYEVKYRADARKTLDGLTRVQAGKDGVITIDVDDHDPRRAADIANAYVSELQEMTKTLAVGEAAQRRLFFERQLKQAKDGLTDAEVALRASGVSESTLKADPQVALQEIGKIKAAVTAAEIKIEYLRGYLTNNSADVRQAQNELFALRSQLRKVEADDSDDASGRGAEYVAKYRDYKYQETLFELMAKQYEMAKLDEAREGAFVQVIDRAEPAERKSRPKKAFIAAASTIAAFSALVVWIFMRSLYARIQEDEVAVEKVRTIRRSLLG